MGRAASVAWMLMPQGRLPSNQLGFGTSLTLPPSLQHRSSWTEGGGGHLQDATEEDCQSNVS